MARWKSEGNESPHWVAWSPLMHGQSQSASSWLPNVQAESREAIKYPSMCHEECQSQQVWQHWLPSPMSAGLRDDQAVQLPHYSCSMHIESLQHMSSVPSPFSLKVYILIKLCKLAEWQLKSYDIPTPFIPNFVISNRCCTTSHSSLSTAWRYFLWL